MKKKEKKKINGKYKKIIAVFLALTFLFSQQCNNIVLAESVNTAEKVNYYDLVYYIYFDECDYDLMKKIETYVTYAYDVNLLDSHDANELLFFYKLEAIEDIDSINDVKNVEELVYYLMLDEHANDNSVNNLTSLQNPDGGFGLAKNYQSDILDTEIAAKALQYLGETTAMNTAVQYIISNQNEDGGFGYLP